MWGNAKKVAEMAARLTALDRVQEVARELWPQPG